MHRSGKTRPDAADKERYCFVDAVRCVVGVLAGRQDDITIKDYGPEEAGQNEKNYCFRGSAEGRRL